MIEGAEHFTYLGLVRHGDGVMLVFREGVLVLHIGRPGGGALLRADMRELLALDAPPAPADAGSATDTASTSSDEDDDHALHPSAVAPEDSARPVRVYGWTPEDDLPPSPRQAPWSPPGKQWGWTASDTPVAWVAAAPELLERAASADRSMQLSLWEDLAAGHLSAPSRAHPATGVVLGLTVNGQRQLWAWEGRWWPAGDPSHHDAGLAPALACTLVRHARWSHACAIPEVAFPRKLTYLGMAQDPAVSLLVFEQGLLVLNHPDPAMVGWHDTTTGDVWDLLPHDMADPLEQAVLTLSDADGSPAVQAANELLNLFLSGELGAGVPTDFFAVVSSAVDGRVRAIRVGGPTAWVPAADPHSPHEDDVRYCVYAASLAPVHDWQRLDDRPLALSCGQWTVPWLLGALRLLTVSRAAPALAGRDWHGTLQPALETLLRSHPALEHDWLLQRRVWQPFASLIALSRRDTRLRRKDVVLLWPDQAIDGLFKTLAPLARVHTVPRPSQAQVDQALGGDRPVLLLFQASDLSRQAAAFAHAGWYLEQDPTPRPVELLKQRIAAALGLQGRERLVGLVQVL